MLREKHVTSVCARRVGLSESRLYHLFKAATGCSFGECTRRLRLAVAQDLLQSSSLSIKEIAAEVGIHPSHLWREFKARLGASPRQCRLSAPRRRATPV